MDAIPLSQPVKRKDQDDVTEVALRKPTAGELRGVNLTDLLKMDVRAALAVLPRVTSPALLPAEVEGLDPADLLALAGGLVGFFVTDAQRAQLEASGQVAH